MGERQLVALVRAQIGDPGLLILDEATSAVDPATEQRITEALRRLSERPDHGDDRAPPLDRGAAEKVFVFDAGRLVEDGTHAELVTLGGVLRRAVRELARQHPGRAGRRRHRRIGSRA